MRVCMFAMLLPQHIIGGMEIHSLDLAKGMAKVGHDVSIITSRHPRGLKEETVDEVKIYYTDTYPTSKTPLGYKAMEKFIELNSIKRFDVIHSQSFSAYLYVSRGLRAKYGIPLVTTLHGTPQSEIRSNLNQGLSPMTLLKVLFHTFNFHFRMKQIVTGSDKIIAISLELAKNVPKEFSIDPKKVKAIYNGIDTERFKPAMSPLKEQYAGKKVLLTVSVLHKQKGVQYIIEAMKTILLDCPNAHLLIVGDGPYRKTLKAQAIASGIERNVTFVGKIPNTELTEYYNLCDVFAIPTVRVEGLPIIELESMSCAKPVVASNIGGIPTVIADGRNGLLSRSGDSGDLADKIIKVLSDDALSASLSKEARKTILAGFSREKMVKDTIQAYADVIGGAK